MQDDISVKTVPIWLHHTVQGFSRCLPGINWNSIKSGARRHRILPLWIPKSINFRVISGGHHEEPCILVYSRTKLLMLIVSILNQTHFSMLYLVFCLCNSLTLNCSMEKIHGSFSQCHQILSIIQNLMHQYNNCTNTYFLQNWL